MPSKQVNISFKVSEEEARKFMKVLSDIGTATNNSHVRNVLKHLYKNIKADYWISLKAEELVIKMLRQISGKTGIRTSTSLRGGLGLTNNAIVRTLPRRCNSILLQISNLAGIPKPEDGINSAETSNSKKVSDLIKLVTDAFE